MPGEFCGREGAYDLGVHAQRVGNSQRKEKQIMTRCILLGLLFVFGTKLYCQSDLFNRFWLSDATTIALTADSSRPYLSELRVIVEPRTGLMHSLDHRNPVVDEAPPTGGIGFETNIVGGLLGLQLVFFLPGQIQFAEEADMRRNGLTRNKDGIVRVGPTVA